MPQLAPARHGARKVEALAQTTGRRLPPYPYSCFIAHQNSPPFGRYQAGSGLKTDPPADLLGQGLNLETGGLHDLHHLACGGLRGGYGEDFIGRGRVYLPGIGAQFLV